MSDAHAADAPGHTASAGGDHHDPADHGDEHGHDDHAHGDDAHGDDAHGDDALGPIDVAAWGAGIVGVAIAVVIAACFALATSGLG